MHVKQDTIFTFSLTKPTKFDNTWYWLGCEKTNTLQDTWWKYKLAHKKKKKKIGS